MSALYPEIEPHARGLLDVGDGHRMYWEVCGNPVGKPALVLHGGPGSGCTTWHRRLFDPLAYRIVLFDQRGCGRSSPHASTPSADLATNTTPRLVADVERLREHLGVERWLLLAGSWGSTLALAWAEENPQRVSEMILFGVTAGLYEEIDWLFGGGLAAHFPAAWTRLRNALPAPVPDSLVVAAYAERLFDPDPAVRAHAAHEWCLWESASPTWPPTTELQPRFRDPAYALAFARIVTHYARHRLWLEDGELLGRAGVLARVPAILIDGRHDYQTVGAASRLVRRWPLAEHVIIEDAGHAAGAPAITRELVRASDRFATRRAPGDPSGSP